MKSITPSKSATALLVLMLGTGCSADTQSEQDMAWRLTEDMSCSGESCGRDLALEDEAPDLLKPAVDMTPDVTDMAPWSVPEGMVEIPAGVFLMGTSLEMNFNAGRSGETPVHEVWLSRYAIDRFEVTASEYAECVSQGACALPGPPTVDNVPNEELCTYGVEGKAQHPINCVDWAQAQAYCTWAGTHLPTEAQWEKAARGPEGLFYPWGNEPKPSCDYTAARGCGEETGTWHVGTSPGDRSPYEVHDLLGNVRELVYDLFERRYYESSPYEDPRGPTSTSSNFRSIRGQSFLGLSTSTYSSQRQEVPPDYSSVIAGFRCAYSGPDGL